MKFLIAVCATLFPVLAMASGTTVSVPLANQKESTVGNTVSCHYATELRLGNKEALNPYQVFVKDDEGIYRQMTMPLRKDANGFYLRLFGYDEVATGTMCPSYIELLVVR